MGAGAKTDPTRLEIEDISRTHHCPLAHKMCIRDSVYVLLVRHFRTCSLVRGSGCRLCCGLMLTFEVRQVSRQAIAEHGRHAVRGLSLIHIYAIGSGTAESVPAEPIWWNYGAFIQQCVDFAILAFCVFLMVKMMNKLMKKKQEAAPAPVPEPSKDCLLYTSRCV